MVLTPRNAANLHDSKVPETWCTPRTPLFPGFHWIWLPNPRKSWTITTLGRSWWVKNPKRCSTAVRKPVPIQTSHEWCRMARMFWDSSNKNAPKVRWSERYSLFNLPRWIQVRHEVLGVGFDCGLGKLETYFMLRNPSEVKGRTTIPYGRDRDQVTFCKIFVIR